MRTQLQRKSSQARLLPQKRPRLMREAPQAWAPSCHLWLAPHCRSEPSLALSPLYGHVGWHTPTYMLRAWTCVDMLVWSQASPAILWRHETPALLNVGGMARELPLLQADLMVNVDTLLADTQSLLARLQEAESGGAEDDTFFAADPSRSMMSLRQPSPEPQPDPPLPASASSSPEENATDEVYEFQVGDHFSCQGCNEARVLLQEISASSWVPFARAPCPQLENVLAICFAS